MAADHRGVDHPQRAVLRAAFIGSPPAAFDVHWIARLKPRAPLHHEGLALRYAPHTLRFYT